MKFDIHFTVTAIATKYNNDTQELIDKSIYLDINMSKDEAANFIFRFGKDRFEVDKYIATICYKDNQFAAICLFEETDECTYIYIIKNFNSFLAQIVEGYIRARTTEKISTIMEFDFESHAEMRDVIPDEFEIIEKENTSGD